MNDDKSKVIKIENNYAFIDSQNLNIGTQKVGWKIDWRKFRKYLAENYGVKEAYLFIGYMSENEDIYEYMHDLGYLVVLKQIVDNRNEEDKLNPDNSTVTSKTEKQPESDAGKSNTVKGNIDADLVLYAMKEIPNYNKAVIVSGDGDFLSLCEYLIDQNKLLAIMTPNWMYSSLYKQLDKWIVRLDLSKKKLSYKKKIKFRNKKN